MLKENWKRKSKQDVRQIILNLFSFLTDLGFEQNYSPNKVDRERTFHGFSLSDVTLFYENNLQFTDNVLEEANTFVLNGEESKIESILNKLIGFLNDNGYRGGQAPW